MASIENRYYEKGAVHLLLVGILVLILAGALGFVGYSAVNRNNKSLSVAASSSDDLEQARAKLDSGDVYALTEPEKTALDKAEVKVDPPLVASNDNEIIEKVQKPSAPKRDTNKSMVELKPLSSASLKAVRPFSTRATELPAYRNVVSIDGKLWFTNANTSYVASMSTSGNIASYKSQILGAHFTPIVKGSDGRVWYAGNTQKIHAMTTSGKETVYSIPSNPTLVESMAMGLDGNIWFTTWNSNQQGVVAKITPNGKVTEYEVPYGSYARGLTKASDGRMWFATNDGAGAISTSGKIQSFSAYGGRSNTPWSIVRGSKGYVWLLGHDGTNGTKLVRVSTSGEIKYYTNESTKNLFRLFEGPGDTVWFSEWTSGRIGRIDSNGKITKFAAPNSLKNAYGITFINRSAWVSYATPLKPGTTNSPGTLVEFAF